ncbi:choice-of-anchor L family PEP-CTERM protein [Marinobacter salexigens]|uniref:choice-of-anchor L family PEP-CTERM protein n=1 Tax=Marinobacter salexigens TaxID=1925763 RepID=UPI000C2935D0|nr:choice-of-anchor L domain-containing protein [Marinobacter salexigens]
MKRILQGVALFSTAVICQSASALVIDSTSTDGNAMANALVGSGITISNVNYVGGSNQSGFFSDGSSVLGIDSGLILTTGSAWSAPGPNTSDGASTTVGTPGDADLDALIPQNTRDAAVLTFDFESNSGDLFFNYVFASEEYNEYVDSSFNDVFAFFVDGVNIAEAPDGQAVSINNVNCGNPYSGIGPNCDYYNNNDLNDGGPYFDIEYDGFTDVFVASILGLSAGSHSMKIAIADAGDSALDSAVFLQGGSFSDTPPEVSVPEPGSLALLLMGLGGLVATRRKQHN